MRTFDIAIDDSNDLLIADYISRANENLPTVAEESTVDMIEDINYLSAKSIVLMEEYRKNPGDVCTFEELKQRYCLIDCDETNLRGDD